MAWATRSSLPQVTFCMVTRPDSMRSMSRMSLISRTSRSVLETAMSSMRLPWSSSSPNTPPAIRPSEPRIEVSGVRSSWPTTETNSSFMRSISRRSVMSLKVTTMPLVSPLSSWIGVLLNSTGNVVPSLRRKCSSPTASPCPERNSPSTMRSKRTRPSSSEGS